MKINKFLSVPIALCIGFASLPMMPFMTSTTIAEAVSTTSGTCGDSLTWEFVDGTLTISGTGTMMEGAYYSDYPWEDIRLDITKVVIEEGVTSIGKNAFRIANAITSVQLPSSMKSISEGAFADCDALTSIAVDTGNPYFTSSDGILYNKDRTTLLLYPGGKSEKRYTIPDNVTTIGDYAFYSCDKLISVTVPQSVEKIGTGAFQLCESLIQVNTTKGLVSIGDDAFAGCSILRAFDTPDTVTDIGAYAFSSCTRLKTVNLPDSLTNIGNYAFYSCNSLDNIRIPDSITVLNDGVFGGCESLSSIIIPKNITSIGYYAFGYCPALTSVVIFGDVESIGDSAFAGCNGLTAIAINSPDCEIFDGENTIYRNAEIYGYDGSTAKSYAKAYNRDFNELLSGTCGDNVNWIFAGGTLTISGHGAIMDYDSYSPKWYKWYDIKKQVVNVIIDDGVTRIGNAAFKDCVNLETLTISDSVTSIGCLAFCNCYVLRSFTIPASVTSIDRLAFEDCKTMHSVGIENPDCEIYDAKDTEYPGKDTLYPGSVIYGYKGSTAESYAKEYGRKFVECNIGTCGESLTWKYLDGVLTISGTGEMTDYSFTAAPPWDRYRDDITKVIIEEGVTSIGDWAFRYYDNITSVTIPDSMTSIGTWAFGDCYQLTSVILPESVTSVDIVAFENCCNLQSVTIHNPDCEIYDYRNTIPSDRIYGYQYSTAEEYAETYGITFIPIDTLPVKGDVNADGIFNVSDVVALQKWLLAVPDATLADWKAADLCEDERLDVFDLCLMKRELLNQ